MRQLTLEEIEILSNRAGVKKIAVENFLMRLNNNSSKETAILNLIYDTKVYNWGESTVQAIMDGIMLAGE